MAHLAVRPARPLQGSLAVPGDKSISHRALLLAALCHGESILHGCLDSDDVRRTRQAVEALGVKIRPVTGPTGLDLAVEGRGWNGFKAPSAPLDMGNSGTTARLLLGILAGRPFQAILVGDESLSQRPMRRVTEPLERMGARFHGPHGPDRLPLTVQGGPLKGIHYELPVPSAQVKSALLLAGLAARGRTTVVEPVSTRDHTERMLRFMGAKIETEPTLITVQPGPLEARDLDVPGDFSSAAFFLVAATIVPGSAVTVQGVGLNPTRTALLEALRRMGARVEIQLEGRVPGRPDPSGLWEPRGDVTVSYAPLKAVTVEPEEVPGLIDELPILMVAATQAEGITEMRGVAELRVKETDRIRSMEQGLSALGARIRSEGEAVVIEGPTRLRGKAVDSLGDHRTAMALAVAGLVAEGTTTVQGSEWVAISFPGFAECLRKIQH